MQDELSILTKRVDLLSGRTDETATQMKNNQTVMQDDISNLTQRVDLLTDSSTKMQQNEVALTERVGLLSTEMETRVEQNHNDVATIQQRMDLLTDSVTEIQKTVSRKESKFVKSGNNLHISKCGKIITKKSGT